MKRTPNKSGNAPDQSKQVEIDAHDLEHVINGMNSNCGSIEKEHGGRLDQIELFCFHILAKFRKYGLEEGQWKGPQGIFAFFLVRSIHLALTQLFLLRIGRIIEMITIGRSAYELFVTAKWISTDPENNYEIYKMQIVKERKKFVDLMEKSAPDSALLQTMREAMLDDIEPANVRAMPKISDIMREMGMHGDYALKYGALSAYAHNTMHLLYLNHQDSRFKLDPYGSGLQPNQIKLGIDNLLQTLCQSILLNGKMLDIDF